MNQQQVKQVLYLFRLEEKHDVVIVSPEDDCGPFFPCSTAPLCDSFNPSVIRLKVFNLPQTWCATGTFHGSGQAEGVRPVCQRTQTGSTWAHSYHQFMIIFSTVVTQSWAAADTNPPTDKWTHATAHIQPSVHPDNPLMHVRARTHAHTHARARSSPDSCDWERLHTSQEACVNGTTACALAAQAQSHLISLAGYLKASDSLLAVIGAAGGDGDIPAAALCTLWAHGEGWSTLRSRGPAATVGEVPGVHVCRCLTRHLLGYNKTRFFLFFLTISIVFLPSPTLFSPHVVTLRRPEGKPCDSACHCLAMSSVLTLNVNQKSICGWVELLFFSLLWKSSLKRIVWTVWRVDLLVFMQSLAKTNSSTWHFIQDFDFIFH